MFAVQSTSRFGRTVAKQHNPHCHGMPCPIYLAAFILSDIPSIRIMPWQHWNCAHQLWSKPLWPQCRSLSLYSDSWLPWAMYLWNIVWPSTQENIQFNRSPISNIIYKAVRFPVFTGLSTYLLYGLVGSMSPHWFICSQGSLQGHTFFLTKKSYNKWISECSSCKILNMATNIGYWRTVVQYCNIVYQS